jgi:O-antigen ligase
MAVLFQVVRNLREAPARKWLLFLFGAAIWFLLISWEFAVSLSMIGLCGLFLFQWYPERRRWGWRQGPGQVLQRFRRDPSWLAAAVPFLLVLISALWSGDGAYTLNRLQVKLPFLVLTLAFSGLAVDARVYRQIHYLLLVLVSLAAIPVLFHYLRDAALYHEVLGQGRSLTTPSNHIRFSMAAALAVCGGLFLLEEGFVWLRPVERWLIGGLVVFLILFLHLLAVRTGLLALYAGLALWVLRYILRHRAWIKGALALIAMALGPWAAYHTLPAFQARMDYMRWDLREYLAGNQRDNSDSNRLLSMQLGWQIFREHPLLGTGSGDLRGQMHRRYAEQAPDHKPLIPHNQWICVLAGTGAIGGFLFLWAFLYPLFRRRRYRLYPFLVLHLIFFLSYWTEPVIENNFGISLLLLFLLPGLSFPDNDQTSSPLER